MEQEERFGWTGFYRGLSDELASYRDKRPKLIGIVKEVHEHAGMKAPKLDRGEPTDIDPFTVFGLFNKVIKDERRTMIAAGIASALGVRADAPTEFPGIPVLNNLSATFYRFEGGRGPNDIENLWEAFEASLAYADS